MKLFLKRNLPFLIVDFEIVFAKVLAVLGQLVMHEIG